MAAKVVSDNKLDLELSTKKQQLEALTRTANSFIANHHQLPSKERARILNEIQMGVKAIQRFVATPQQHELTNAGTRFALETLRSTLNTFLGRWAKFERDLG